MNFTNATNTTGISGPQCTTKDTFNLTATLELIGEFPESSFFDYIKPLLITRHISGAISVVASVTLMWTILRSHVGLSSTMQRLLFGLCVSDVLSSSANMLATIMVPKDFEYMFPWVYGNGTTCTFQGFCHVWGLNSGLLYNCSICIYYLAIVKYNVKDEVIRKRIEPYLHAFSICYPLTGAIIGVATQSLNQYGQICSFRQYRPLHCIFCDDGEVPEGFDLPCGRGSTANLLIHVFGNTILAGTPIIITVTMVLMYRAVAKIQKRNNRYGRTSIIANLNNADDTSRFCKIMHCLVPCMTKSDTAPTRRGKQQNGKKNILIRAFAYNGAWFLSFLPFIIHRISSFAGIRRIPPSFFFIDSIFQPLQGLFNFLIYTYPKVVQEKKKNSRESVSWLKAFCRAVMSKGGKRATRATPLNDSFPQSLLKSSTAVFRSFSNRIARRKSSIMNRGHESSSRTLMDKSENNPIVNTSTQKIQSGAESGIKHSTSGNDNDQPKTCPSVSPSGDDNNQSKTLTRVAPTLDVNCVHNSNHVSNGMETDAQDGVTSGRLHQRSKSVRFTNQPPNDLELEDFP